MGRMGPDGLARARSSWLRQGIMGLRPEAGPTGTTGATLGDPCAGAGKDGGGGGTATGSTAAMAGDGGTITSEHLSKMRSRPNTDPPP
jgi:hypothetical protein